MKVVSRVAKVDKTKCVGCRECERHCPTDAVAVRDHNEPGYVSPCNKACPAGIDVKGYIALAAAGDYEGAYRLIRQANPFPSVCGRICTHECQAVCNRGTYDRTIAIREIKRFVSDQTYKDGGFPKETRQQLNGKKIAVIGAGPSGLSCAYYLALSGYAVDVYESEKAAGGVLLFGIPEYRLPAEVLERDIKSIENIGVNIILNTTIGKDITLEEIEQKYNAVYIATGTQFSKKANIPGEDLPGIYHGLDFLKAASIGENPTIGKKIVVLGGGSTAIDASRTALRMGADSVTILYRRRKTDMPAEEQEILEALQEGVKIKELVAPLEIRGNGKVEKIVCTAMETAGLDEELRRKAVPVTDSEFEIDADTVIVAVSQYADFPFVDKEEVVANKMGQLVLDEKGMTSKAYIFAGGDVVRGSASAIQSIADGKRAAYRINEYLGQPYDIYVGDEIKIPERVGRKLDRAPAARINNLPVDERVHSNDEVNCGLTEEQIRTECSRCLECGGTASVNSDLCLDCTLCWELCPHEAIKLDILPEKKTVSVKLAGPDQMEKMIEICNKAFYRPLDEICQCTGTNAEEVVSAIMNGAHDIKEIHRVTGAGGGCGGGYCANMIYRLLDAAGYPQEDPGDDSHHPVTTYLQNMPIDAGDHDSRFHFREIRAGQFNEAYVKSGNDLYREVMKERSKK